LIDFCWGEKAAVMADFSSAASKGKPASSSLRKISVMS